MDRNLRNSRLVTLKTELHWNFHYRGRIGYKCKASRLNDSIT